MFLHLFNTTLRMDHFLLQICSHVPATAVVEAQSQLDGRIVDPEIITLNLTRHETQSLQFWVYKDIRIYFLDRQTDKLLCSGTVSGANEHSVFSTSLTFENTIPTCITELTELGNNRYSAGLLYCILLIFLLFGINKFEYTQRLRSRCSLKKRISSVDTFRGLTVSTMILIHYFMGGYALYPHYGFSLTVTIQPIFLFITGMSIELSVDRTKPSSVTLLHIFLRYLSIFCINLHRGRTEQFGPLDAKDSFGIHKMVNLFFTLIIFCASRKTRGMLCVALVGSLLHLHQQGYLSVARLILYDDALTRLAIVGFVVHSVRWLSQRLWPNWLLALLGVVTHASLTFARGRAGCPSGYIHITDLRYPRCKGGFGYEIDRFFLDRSIDSQTIDGLDRPSSFVLSHFHALFVSTAGLETSRVLLGRFSTMQKLAVATVSSTGLILTTCLLCDGSATGLPIPIRFHTWTLSYTTGSVAIAIILATIVHFIIDIWGMWSGFPFTSVGRNALLLWSLHWNVVSVLPFADNKLWQMPQQHIDAQRKPARTRMAVSDMRTAEGTATGNIVAEPSLFPAEFAGILTIVTIFLMFIAVVWCSHIGVDCLLSLDCPRFEPRIMPTYHYKHSVSNYSLGAHRIIPIENSVPRSWTVDVPLQRIGEDCGSELCRCDSQYVV